MDYLWKRVLRIYPALIIVLVLSVGLAYLIYQPTNKYFNFKKEAIDYVLNNLSLYHNQWRIHGVFDALPNTAINGSLWTMGFEFFFYLVLLILYPIRKYPFLSQVILLSTIILLFIGNIYFIDELRVFPFRLRVDFIFELGLFFMIGAFFATINWDTLLYKKTNCNHCWDHIYRHHLYSAQSNMAMFYMALLSIVHWSRLLEVF